MSNMESNDGESNGKNFTVRSEAPLTSEGTHSTARQLPTPANLFSVPEDREVLQTPQENRNSGYVFGDGPPSSASDTAPASMAPRSSTPFTFSASAIAKSSTPFPEMTKSEPVSSSSIPFSFFSSISSASVENAAAIPIALPATVEDIPTTGTDTSHAMPFVKDMSVEPSTPRSDPTGSDHREAFSTPPRIPEAAVVETAAVIGANNVMSTRNTSASLILAPPSFGTYDRTIPTGRCMFVAAAGQPWTIAPEQLPTAPAPTFSFNEPPVFSQNAAVPTSQPPRPDQSGPELFTPSCYGISDRIDSNLRAINESVNRMRADRLNHRPIQIAFDREFELNRSKLLYKPRKFRFDFSMPEYAGPGKHWKETLDELDETERRNRSAMNEAIDRCRDQRHKDTETMSGEETGRAEPIQQNAVKTFRQIQNENPGKPIISIDGLSLDQMEELLPKSLEGTEYYTVPEREQLLEILFCRGKDGLKNLIIFKIGRRGVGEIAFNGPINIEKLDIIQEIEIEHGHIHVKDAKQIAGIPVKVTLYKIFKDLLFDVVESTRKDLENICTRRNITFVSYDKNGTWVFKVEDLKNL